MARAKDPNAKLMFEALSHSRFIVMAFHTQRHWLALRISSGLIELADSDPAPCHTASVCHFARILESWTGMSYSVSQLAVPLQPPGSAECGVHTTVNCLALAWDCLKPIANAFGHLSYAPLRDLMPKVAAKELDFMRPSAFFLHARTVAHQNARSPFAPISRTTLRAFLATLCPGSSFVAGFFDPNDQSWYVVDRTVGSRSGARLFNRDGSPLELPRDILCLASAEFYDELPDSVIKQCNPQINSKPYAVLPQFYFAGTSSITLAPGDPIAPPSGTVASPALLGGSTDDTLPQMDDESFEACLSQRLVGDKLEVRFSESGGPMESLVGTLASCRTRRGHTQGSYGMFDHLRPGRTPSAFNHP